MRRLKFNEGGQPVFLDDLKMLQALVVAMFLAVPYWKHRYVKKKGDANHG